MTLSRMSITLPAELLDAVIERANSNNVTRSALTIRALAAYLEFISIREPYMPDITEVIRLHTQLEGKDELIKSKNETIGALRLALDIRNVKGETCEIKGDKQNSDLKKRSLQFL
jgi:metal-responsive CopG/Arc/MetJ family transcriptional regulator